MSNKRTVSFILDWRVAWFSLQVPIDIWRNKPTQITSSWPICAHVYEAHCMRPSVAAAVTWVILRNVKYVFVPCSSLTTATSHWSWLTFRCDFFMAHLSVRLLCVQHVHNHVESTQLLYLVPRFLCPKTSFSSQWKDVGVFTISAFSYRGNIWGMKFFLVSLLPTYVP